MKRVILLALIMISAANSYRISAQYYNTGQAPASLHWKMIKSDSLRIIYPQGFDAQARRTLYYMEYVRPSVNYGFKLPPLKTPVVLNTQNFLSNGISILTPKRIEIVGIPSIDTYSEPWLKQLAVHEYRHMVQYANVNRSTVKVFSWLFGQQATLLATGLVPFWFIEGDATMLETQMATFGRGLQPSFTMHYRALGQEILRSKNPDKWFCGTYNDYVPSHYELGFQIVSYADKKYDKYIGDAITRFTANFPFLIFTSDLGLYKYHRTSEKRLFREAFTELNKLWDSLPKVENSATTISPPVKRYTTYSYPLFLDTGRLLVLKKDLDRTSRFVEINTATGSERTLCYTGIVNTRPVMKDGKVMWTEYRQSTFWEQKMNSSVCSMDVGEWRPETVKQYGQTALYPTNMENGLTAYVKYHYDGYYSIEVYAPVQSKTKDSFLINSIRFPESTSIHGLAWDSTSSSLYYIGLSDDGMWIGGIRKPELRPEKFDVKTPAYVTLGDLSATDGMLYFNSIYSGKDEVHTIDLASKEEYRITNSRYGTFSPSASPNGEFVAVTTYDRQGYKAALQEVEYWEQIPWSATPRNIVNAPLKKWDVRSMDDIVFTTQQQTESEHKYKAKKYRKGLHLFDVHSWAPLYFEPDKILSDPSFDEIQIGATAISQNVLSTATSIIGYGYATEGNSVVRGKFVYEGWAPKIDIEAFWSDKPHKVYDLSNDDGTQYRGNSVSVNATVSLPMLLTSGYHIRSLTPLVRYNFKNAEIIHPTGSSERQSLILASIQYVENVRRAPLDIQPRWGYSLRASIGGNPFSNLYSTAWSAYGRLYTPGLFLHHGFTFSAAYQKASAKSVMIGVIDFQPHGFNAVISPAQYMAASVNYTLPIAYPNWGLSGIVFLKRILLRAGYEYARYTEAGNVSKPLFGRAATEINSYGGTIYFDIAPLRMPSESTSTLSVSIYKPSGKKIFWNVGFSIPL